MHGFPHAAVHQVPPALRMDEVHGDILAWDLQLDVMRPEARPGAKSGAHAATAGQNWPAAVPLSFSGLPQYATIFK